MKYSIIITLLSFYACSSVESDSQKPEMKKEANSLMLNSDTRDSLKCNISFVLNLKRNIANNSDEHILYFLYTFDKDCRNNVEFSEFGNEMLFEILDKKPERVINILSTHQEIAIPEIMEQLKNPISDKIDITSLIEKVKLLKKSEIRDKIISALSYDDE